MSDRRHPGYSRATQERTERDQGPSQPYPPPVDPAYGVQQSYYPQWSSASTPGMSTDRLPQYWGPGQPPPGQVPPSPEPDKPKAPRWLWIAAAAAVILVIGLVVALVIANGTASRQTAVPALPSSPSSPRPIPVVPRAPSHRARPPHVVPTEPSQPTEPGAMQTVVYNVSGDGRAISITYVDNDGMMQTEFNVGLPWNKEVSLPDSGNKSPNVTIVNIGHEVTCSLTVDGVEVSTRTGAGLTICNSNS